MKILMLNTSDTSGGAAKACYRIFERLQKSEGLDARMLVRDKFSGNRGVISQEGAVNAILNKVKRLFEALIVKVLLNTENKITHSPGILSSLNKKIIDNFDPDIIHLHWICDGFISINDVKKIEKPIVWTLHDMWAFCGAEHYAKDTTRYVEGYTNGNKPGFESGFDLNRWVWKRKMKNWKDLDLTIVTPSNWLAECARKSKLLKDRKIVVIPNGIDLGVFRPIDKKIARDKFDLPSDKKLILFGAMNATDDPRKGFGFLREALKEMHKTGKMEDVELVIFGSSEKEGRNDFGFKINYLGKISDEATLPLVYSCANLFVVPSLEDNLPNTIVEALACGIPCAGFNTGGIPDMIDHKNNGYLAEFKDAKDLAFGMEWILNNEDYGELSENARKKAENNFDDGIVSEKYKKLYGEILERKKYVKQ